MIVADSDVLIDFLEGRAPAANRIALELDRGQLRTTVITRFELLAGAKTARQLKLVGELLDALPCLPLDVPGADAAAEIRRTLERDGVGIGMADSLIAGIVVAHQGVLLTRNRRHFERVPGLPLGRMGRTEGGECTIRAILKPEDVACLDRPSAWRPMLRDALAYGEGAFCSPLSQPLGWTGYRATRRAGRCAPVAPLVGGHGYIAAGMARQQYDLELARHGEEGWRATFLSGRHRPLDDGLCGHGLADDAVRRDVVGRIPTCCAVGRAARRRSGSIRHDLETIHGRTQQARHLLREG